MKKIIKKIGNSKGIIFNQEECQINQIEIGKIIDIKKYTIKKPKEEEK